MQRRCRWLVGLILAGATGCGSEDPPSPADCLEVKPGATTGVYGCVTATNDVGSGSDIEPKVLPDLGVQVFVEQPPPTPDDGLTPLSSTKSNSLGFYELTLPTGSYFLCTTFRRCTSIEVRANEPLRRNYDFSHGLGW